MRPDDERGVRLKLVNQGVVAADSSTDDILIADKRFVTVGVTDDLFGKAGTYCAHRDDEPASLSVRIAAASVTLYGQPG